MATVSSFESMTYPSKSQLRQFAELFTPLFRASSDEAKRQAVSALSRCPNVPPAVAMFIGCQPIEIAAPFLSGNKDIDDDTLITIARTQGAAHARAIVRRDSLSPKVIDALVGLRQAEPDRGAIRPQESPAAAAEPPVENSVPTVAVELPAVQDSHETLRQKIKQLARRLGNDPDDRLGLRTISEIQEALLVRFARGREALAFAAALSDSLSTSRWLSERIMLDISGHQLAATLTSLGMNFLDAVFILERFYPHLAERLGETSRAWHLLDSLDPEECDARVEAWRRADRYTYDPAPAAPMTQTVVAANAPRPVHQVHPARDMRVVAKAFGRR